LIIGPAGLYQPERAIYGFDTIMGLMLFFCTVTHDIEGAELVEESDDAD
jgi:hypothetical protein